MAEYIDREKIREEVCDDCTRRIGKDGCMAPEACEDLLTALVAADTEDVARVVHGEWIQGGYACGETEWKCSNCGETEWRTSCNSMKYCMFCGAKMDGGEKDAEVQT